MSRSSYETVKLVGGLKASLFVAAWGIHAHPNRVQQVRRLLGPEVMALAWTKAGQPRHPLYIKGDTVPQPWAP